MQSPERDILQYRPTTADAWGMHTYLRLREWQTQFTYLKTFLMYLMTAASLAWLADARGADYLLVVAGLIGFMAVLGQVRMRRSVAQLVKTRLHTGEPHSVRLDGDGAHVQCDHAEALYRWSAINTVVEKPDALYLFMGPSEGIPLPRRAFASAEAMHGCALEARRLREAGTNVGRPER